jgi:hypothetical protein
VVTASDTPLSTPSSAPGFEYPAQLLNDAAVGPYGLRSLYIGDDGEWLVILGHPELERVQALCDAVNCCDEPPGEDAVIRTWARLLTTCPEHEAPKDGCTVCEIVTPVTWWLDWQPATEPTANAGQPGYFPITVLGE